MGKMTNGPSLEFLYQDNGCELAPKCLECPLPVCKYDGYRNAQKKLLREIRDRRIREMKLGGAAVAEIAESLGVSLRTVFRGLGQTSVMV